MLAAPRVRPVPGSLLAEPVLHLLPLTEVHDTPTRSLTCRSDRRTLAFSVMVDDYPAILAALGLDRSDVLPARFAPPAFKLRGRGLF